VLFCNRGDLPDVGRFLPSGQTLFDHHFSGAYDSCRCFVCFVLDPHDFERAVIHGRYHAVGVGVANSILVVVFAEERRMTGISAKTAAITGAAARLRPVLMTSIAMISGMVPMALGMSEGGDRTAPLWSSGDWRIDRFDLLRTSRFAFDLRHRATKV